MRNQGKQMSNSNRNKRQAGNRNVGKDKPRAVAPSSVGNSIVFPNRAVYRLTTSGATTLTPGGLGLPVSASLSLNSAFDPDYSGTGTSPRYFDTLFGSASSAAPYGKYAVVAARVKIDFVNQNSVSGGLGDVCVFARSSLTGALDTASEFYTAENAVADVLGSGYTDRGIKTFALEYNSALMAKLQNWTGPIETSPNQVADYNADPAVEILCDFYYCPFSSSSVLPIYVRWTIEQDVMCLLLNETVESLPRPPRPRADKPFGPRSALEAEAAKSHKCGNGDTPEGKPRAAAPVCTCAQHGAH